MNIVGIKFAEKTDIFTTKARFVARRDYVRALASMAERIPGEPHVYRFVDLDCDDGAFAAFAAMRWPYAWIDAYGVGTDEEARRLAVINAQSGTRFFDGIPEMVPKCDALHVGLGAKGLQFDGASLAALKIAIWEWDSTSALENQVGLMNTCGLDVKHVQTIEPGRGLSMFFRTRPIAAPIVVDMTRKKPEAIDACD